MKRSMKHLLGIVTFAASMTAQSADRMSMPDSTWVTKVAQGGMAEVELGKLAQTNGASDAVKQFGQRMVTDHSKANEELAGIAKRKNVSVPSTLDAKSEATKERLSKLNGPAFDRAYIADMVKDHRMDVAEFKKEANSGQDAEVKAFAAKTLPTLEEHLKMAEDAAKTVNKK
jgi:putative membrane protein